MRALRAAWASLWFAPAPCVNLAAARIIISVHALWILSSRDLAAVSGLPAEFWTELQPGTRWRYLLFPGHPDLENVLQWTARISLLAAAWGLFPRACCLVSALILYHLAPLETAFWTPAPYERGLTISVLALTTLALSRCGDALSPGGDRPASDSWEYGWPLKLVKLFICQIYLASGAAKLLRVGWDWVSAENLRGWLLLFTQQDQVAVFTGPGRWLADQPALCWAAAACALLFNLGFITVLFSKRALWLFLPAAVVFHVGVLFAMNIAFLNLPQLLVFVDWSALDRRLRPPAGPAAAPSGT